MSSILEIGQISIQMKILISDKASAAKLHTNPCTSLIKNLPLPSARQTIFPNRFESCPATLTQVSAIRRKQGSVRHITGFSCG